MSKFVQRLQVFIDEDRLLKLKESAEREGVPVGQWVRDAIDRPLSDGSQAERLRAFLEFVESNGPAFEDDFDSVTEVRAARDARINHLMKYSDAAEGDDRSV